MKQERSFSFDEKTGKYILLIKQEAPVVGPEEKELAMQFSETKQVWEADEINKLVKQVGLQEKKVAETLETTEAKMKQIGQIKPRERDMLKDFKNKIEKVQKLQQLEQLEMQQKTQRDMLAAIQKDKKEMQDAINARVKQD